MVSVRNIFPLTNLKTFIIEYFKNYLRELVTDYAKMGEVFSLQQKTTKDDKTALKKDASEFLGPECRGSRTVYLFSRLKNTCNIYPCGRDVGQSGTFLT